MAQKQLFSAFIETPIGTMIAVADENVLYLLEFADCFKLPRELERLKKATRSAIIAGNNVVLSTIQSEVQQYFAGNLTAFKTSIKIIGSQFQHNVWSALQEIPYGHTHSYATVAKTLNKPHNYRAVARANSTNKLAIIIPCHRVINASGGLSGYAGGIARKQWLLDHEKSALHTIFSETRE